MIRLCTLACSKKPHAQDQIHGLGKRVYNENKHKDHTILRCTICGNEERINHAPSSKK